MDSTTWLAVGNFYGVQPFEGRYDAMNPTAFSFDHTTNQFRYQYELPAISGEARDTRWIRTPGVRLLVIARNNDRLVFLNP